MRKNKDNSADSDAVVPNTLATNLTEEEAAATAVTKGRPTPKRKAQEAKNQRGLVIDPKASNKDRKAKVRSDREKEYAAMRAGDERNMPAEHRGPERRFLRDYVDARTSLGEFLLPLSIVFVIGSLFLDTEAIGGLLILVFYVIVLIAGVDTFLMIRRIKKAFIVKFGDGKLPRGWTFYVISRHFNLRRFRVPRPKVDRKEFPV